MQMGIDRFDRIVSKDDWLLLYSFKKAGNYMLLNSTSMSMISNGRNYGEYFTSMMGLVSSNRIVLFTISNKMMLFDNL